MGGVERRSGLIGEEEKKREEEEEEEEEEVPLLTGTRWGRGRRGRVEASREGTGCDRWSKMCCSGLGPAFQRLESAPQQASGAVWYGVPWCGVVSGVFSVMLGS